MQLEIIKNNYLYVPGFITNLTYTIPEEASWEIALNSPEGKEDEGLMETPKYFEVDVAFTPIHDFTPRLNDGGRDVAFITNSTGVGGTKNQYLDDNKIYFFSNGADGIYGPGEETNLASNAGGVSTISSTNLDTYGTKGSTPSAIAIADTVPATPPALTTANQNLTSGTAF